MSSVKAGPTTVQFDQEVAWPQHCFTSSYQFLYISIAVLPRYRGDIWSVCAQQKFSGQKLITSLGDNHHLESALHHGLASELLKKSMLVS
jgi:hypothetical protein